MNRIEDQAAGLRARAQLVRSQGFQRSARSVGARRASGLTWTVTVTSGKGGVGKTQLTANLASSLAQRGLRVLLLDADLGLASLDLALGVQPRHDLMDVLRGNARLDEIVVPCGDRLDLVPACPGRYEMANLDPDARNHLMDLVRELAEGYDVLLIDTGAGIGSTTVAFAAEADEVLLVVTPDPASLRDAYAMAKVLHVRGDVRRLNLVANQVTDAREALALKERLQGIVDRFFALELALLGAIPSDREVVAGARAGRPCVLRSPDSAGARGYQSVAQRVREMHRKEASC